MTLIQGDALKVLPELAASGETFDCCLTSPPYFQMVDYEVQWQLGLEPTVEEYLSNQVQVFRPIRQMLPQGGVCFVVIGDTMNNYSAVRGKGERAAGVLKRRRKLQPGYLEKEPLQIPWRFAEALRGDGWKLRGIFPWDKGSTNSTARSDTGSCSHEYILQLYRWDSGGRPYLKCRPWVGSVFRCPPAPRSSHRCPFPQGLADFYLGQIVGSSVIDQYVGSGVPRSPLKPWG